MRGAGTSIAGNALGPGLIVDVARHLHGITALDPDARTVTALPGTVLDDVNAAARVHGLRVGPDPSSHSRCTVGGMVGNDACGSHSVAWGTTAENVLSLGLVTADGVARTSDELGPALDARLRAFVGRHTDLLRAELPPWPRRVSGYALDWLLPERGFEVARALTGTEGTCAVVVVGDAAARRAARRERPARARVRGRRRGRGRRAGAPHRGSAHRREPGASSCSAGRDARCACRRAARGCSSRPVARRGRGREDHAARLEAAIGRRPGSAASLVLDDPRERAALWRAREDGAGRVGAAPRRHAGVAGLRGPRRPARPSRGLHRRAAPPARATTASRARSTATSARAACTSGSGFGLDRPGGEERLAPVHRGRRGPDDRARRVAQRRARRRPRAERAARTPVQPGDAGRVRRMEGDLGPGRACSTRASSSRRGR